MKCSPFALSVTAGVITLLVSQCVLPTVRALPLTVPDYRAQVQGIKAIRTLSGLMITGRVTNTGNEPLTYTKVMPVLEDQKGRTLSTGSGYLTVSPLRPGQTAEFRAWEPDARSYSQLHIAIREAGCPVLVEDAMTLTRHLAASRRGAIAE